MAQSRKKSAKYNMAGPSQNKNSEIYNMDEESPDTPVLQYYKVFSDIPAAPLQDDAEEINKETRIFFNIKGSTSMLFSKPSKTLGDMVTPPAPPSTPVCSSTCGNEDNKSDFSSDEESNEPISPEELLKQLPSRGYLLDKAAAFTGVITRSKSKMFKEKEKIYTGIIKPKKNNIVNKCVNNVMNKFRMQREDFYEPKK